MLRAASSRSRARGLSPPPRSRSALMPRPRIILLAVGRNFHVNAALSTYFRYLPPLWIAEDSWPFVSF